MLLAEGATAGSGLFLQGIPSVPHFSFSSQVMRTQIKSMLGVSPTLFEPWNHSCGGGKLLKLQNDKCSHLYHCSQQGRAYGTHGAVLEQVQDMLLDARYGYGWRMEITVENPGAPPDLCKWRADLFGFGPSGECILVDVSVTCLTGDSAMRSRGMDMRGRVEALLRDVEMRKIRNPRIEAATRARNALFVPFVLSSNGALGARANAFLKLVFDHVKKEGQFGMRSSHPSRASTWSTTWFSTFWRQRISTAATATSASFLDKILRADQAAALEGSRSRKPHSRFPRHYYYNPNHGRQHTQYRSRSQELRSDNGRTDVSRTNRNNGARPLVWWSNNNVNMTSHHRHQGRGFYVSQGSGARS